MKKADKYLEKIKNSLRRFWGKNKNRVTAGLLAGSIILSGGYLAKRQQARSDENLDKATQQIEDLEREILRQREEAVAGLTGLESEMQHQKEDIIEVFGDEMQVQNMVNISALKVQVDGLKTILEGNNAKAQIANLENILRRIESGQLTEEEVTEYLKVFYETLETLLMSSDEINLKNLQSSESAVDFERNATTMILELRGDFISGARTDYQNIFLLLEKIQKEVKLRSDLSREDLDSLKQHIATTQFDMIKLLTYNGYGELRSKTGYIKYQTISLYDEKDESIENSAFSTMDNYVIQSEFTETYDDETVTGGYLIYADGRYYAMESEGNVFETDSMIMSDHQGVLTMLSTSIEKVEEEGHIVDCAFDVYKGYTVTYVIEEDEEQNYHGAINIKFNNDGSISSMQESGYYQSVEEEDESQDDGIETVIDPNYALQTSTKFASISYEEFKDICDGAKQRIEQAKENQSES